jgi:hypothetical protein
VLEVGRYRQPDSSADESTQANAKLPATTLQWTLRFLLLVSVLVLLAVLFLEQSFEATSQTISSVLNFNF